MTTWPHVGCHVAAGSRAGDRGAWPAPWGAERRRFLRQRRPAGPPARSPAHRLLLPGRVACAAEAANRGTREPRRTPSLGPGAPPRPLGNGCECGRSRGSASLAAPGRKPSASGSGPSREAGPAARPGLWGVARSPRNADRPTEERDAGMTAPRKGWKIRHAPVARGGPRRSRVILAGPDSESRSSQRGLEAGSRVTSRTPEPSQKFGARGDGPEARVPAGTHPRVQSRRTRIALPGRRRWRRVTSGHNCLPHSENREMEDTSGRHVRTAAWRQALLSDGHRSEKEEGREWTWNLLQIQFLGYSHFLPHLRPHSSPSLSLASSARIPHPPANPACQCSRGLISAIGHGLFSDFPLPSYIENNALKGRQLRFLQDQFHLKFLACKEGTGEGAPLNGRSGRCD